MADAPKRSRSRMSHPRRRQLFLRLLSGPALGNIILATQMMRGVHRDMISRERRRDPDFDRAVDEAILQGRPAELRAFEATSAMRGVYGDVKPVMRRPGDDGFVDNSKAARNAKSRWEAMRVALRSPNLVDWEYIGPSERSSEFNLKGLDPAKYRDRHDEPPKEDLVAQLERFLVDQGVTPLPTRDEIREALAEATYVIMRARERGQLPATVDGPGTERPN